MPTTTRNQQRRQDQEEQEHPYGEIEDRVAHSAPLYPVFCTAHIPPPVLDDFIDKAYEGSFAMVHGDPGGSGAAPCILQTTDLDSITHGSRKPMPPDFESPFLGMTDHEVRDWMSRHKHPNFAEFTFTILDQNAVERGISRIGYIDEKDPDDQMLWADFYADLYTRVPLEMSTISWHEIDQVGTEEVVDRKELERGSREVERVAIEKGVKKA